MLGCGAEQMLCQGNPQCLCTPLHTSCRCCSAPSASHRFALPDGVRSTGSLLCWSRIFERNFARQFGCNLLSRSIEKRISFRCYSKDLGIKHNLQISCLCLKYFSSTHFRIDSHLPRLGMGMRGWIYWNLYFCHSLALWGTVSQTLLFCSLCLYMKEF